ncbi:rod shape-determining protein RodA [Candidatus Uhrbacteria bacterium]|nr:rod shape-determining protein RodA [Candidatus Uhrbacteria bacterium]
MLSRLRLHLARFDWLLLLAAGVLIIIGITTIWSVALARDPGNSGTVIKQGVAAGLGLALMIMLAASNYRLLKNYRWVIFIIALALLAAVLFFGQTVRGTTGWLRAWGWNFQPVEFAKFALVVFLAGFLSDHPRAAFGRREFLISSSLVAVAVILVLWEPDFGSALILLALWIGLLFFARIRKRFLLFTVGGLALAAVAAWIFFAPYQRERIMTFFDPGRDPLGRGYNVTQALVAVGAGESWGRGLGFGSQSQLRFLPESQTDFIFAVIAEEFGLVGVTVVLLFFGLLFWRMLLVARTATDDFSSFLTLGILLIFTIQTLINIGMNLGLLPVTGITLPLLSYGGSSLLMLLIMIGVVQSIAVRRPLVGKI